VGKAGKVLLGVGLFVGGVALPGLGLGLGAAFTSAASLGLTSLGLGMLSRQLFGPAALANRGAEIRQNIANPLAELPVVYGTAKVGLKLVDIRIGTSNPRKLYLVGALCHGSQSGLGVNAIQRIWFDEKLAFNAAGVLQSAFKKGATSYAAVTKYLGTEAQTADSTMTTAFASQWTSAHRGLGVAYLVFELTLHQDIYQGIPNITVEVQGAKILDPRQSSATYSFLNNPPLEVLDYLLSPIYGIGAGRRLALSAGAVTNSGMGAFTAANVVDGNPDTVGFNTDGLSAGAYVQFDFGRPVEIDRCDVWHELNLTPTQQWQIQYADAAGGPYTTISVAGGNPFDSRVERRNTFRWASHGIGAHRYARLRLNNSPGASVSDIMGVDWYETEIDYQSFADEANVADQGQDAPPTESAYKLASGSTALNPLRLTIVAHGWSTGNRVGVELAPGFYSPRLVDVGGLIEGRTYTITVVDADTISLDGTNVNASPAYVANSLRVGKLIPQPQYQADGVLDTGQEPQENLRQMLAAFRGRIVYQGGRFRCHTRKTTSTTVQFTDEDIRSIRWIVPGSKEKVNRVRAAFLNIERDWQPDERQYPRPGIANSYLTEDNGFGSDLDMDLPMVTSAYQADRLAQVALRESRDGISLEATLNERGLLAQVGTVAGITLASPVWTAKPFWVEAVALSPEGQPVLLFQEYEPNAYVLTDAQLHSSLPNTGLPDATAAPAAPTGLTLTAGDAELIASPNGDWIPRIKVAWTPSVTPFGDYIEVQAKRAAEADYDTWGRPPAEDTLFFLSPVTSGEDWDVRIRVVTTLGIASDWVSDTVTVAPVTRAPARGVVEYFEDFPGSPARWTSLSGAATPAVVTTSDAQYGGKVLQCANGDKGYLWTTYIPFDRTILYSLRSRFRKLRERNGAITATLSLGVICYDAGLNLLKIGGAGSSAASDGIAALFNAGSISLGVAWTDVRAFFRGWNGAWYAPPAAVLTNTGFNVTSLAAVGDGTTSGDAFNWDLAGSGSTLKIDLGVGITKRFCRARIWIDATGSMTAQFKWQYSDNGSSWTDVTLRSGGTTWSPTTTNAWNEIDWDATSIGSHRYWQLVLVNSPGASEPHCHELQLLELSDTGIYGTHNTWPEWDDPCPLPPGTAYIRPYFLFVGDGTVTDAILELDVFEVPAAAGATALV
jgi:hypothetical protein